MPNLPDKSSGKCLICTHPHRKAIEKMLVVGGFTYSEIERQFADASTPAPRRSVSYHARYCLDYEQEAIRKMLESNAEERGINVETATRRIIMNKSYLQLTVEKGWEALVESNIAPEPKDVHKAIELLDKLEDRGVNWTIERIERQYQAITQAVKEIVPTSLLPAILERTKQIYEGADATIPNIDSTDRGGDSKGTNELPPGGKEPSV